MLWSVDLLNMFFLSIIIIKLSNGTFAVSHCCRCTIFSMNLINLSLKARERYCMWTFLLFMVPERRREIITEPFAVIKLRSQMLSKHKKRKKLLMIIIFNNMHFFSPLIKGHQQRRVTQNIQRGAAVSAARELGIGNRLHGKNYCIFT